MIADIATPQQVRRDRERAAKQMAHDASLAGNFWQEVADGQRRAASRHLNDLGTISRSRRHRYLEELKDCISFCLDHEKTMPLRIFCRRWIKAGAPVDPKILFVPRHSLSIVLRQVVTALPRLARHHADARLWLKSSQFRPMGVDVNGHRVYPAQVRSIGGKSGIQYEKPFEETFIPFNLLLYAPRDSPYERFNKIGFTLELEDDE